MGNIAFGLPASESPLTSRFPSDSPLTSGVPIRVLLTLESPSEYALSSEPLHIRVPHQIPPHIRVPINVSTYIRVPIKGPPYIKVPIGVLLTSPLHQGPHKSHPYIRVPIRVLLTSESPLTSEVETRTSDIRDQDIRSQPLLTIILNLHLKDTPQTLAGGQIQFCSRLDVAHWPWCGGPCSRILDDAVIKI